MAIQYYMRGYNTSAPGAVGYVDWVVNDVPDSLATYVPAPYSSVNITNIIVNKTVTSKVDNFLKPFESLTAIGGTGYDGYFFHLNSYDWLHATPPGPPIPVPSYKTGLSVVRGTADGIIPRDYATLFWAEDALKWLFAYNTNGDGYTIGAALPISMGSLSIDGYLEVGNDPAESGIIRIPNNQFLVSRNATNTGDGYLIGQDDFNRVRLGSPTGNQIYIPANLRVDGYIRDGGANTAESGFIRNSNNTSIITFKNFTITEPDITVLSSTPGNLITLGDEVNFGTRFNTADGYEHIFQVDSVNLFRVGNTSTTTYINFENTSPNPIVSQLIRSIGNGQNLTFRAQGTSDVSGFGGSTIISSGQGPSADGYVDLRINNIPKIRVFGANVPITADLPNNSINNPDSIQLITNTIRWYNTILNPTITQDSDNTNSITGQPLVIKSQDTTGNNTVGGNLILQSGAGTTIVPPGPFFSDGYLRHGRILFKSGSITNIIGEFGIDGYGSYFSSGGNLDNPASVDGYFRVPNNVWALSAARNPATPPTASIHLIGTDINNSIVIGDVDDTIRIPGTLFIGTFNSSTDLLVEDRIIHANFNEAVVGPVVPPPSLITGFTIHRGDDGSGGPAAYNDEAGWIWVEGLNINADDGYWKAASILGGDDNTLSTSLNIMGRSLSITNDPNTAAGTLPAVGGLRTLNNNTAVSARNFAGTQDLLLLGTDASDHIVMGAVASPFNTGFIFNTTLGSVYDFRVNSISNKVMIGDGYVRFGATPALDGYVRASQDGYNINIITARKVDNSADLKLLGVDGYDRITHGLSALNKGHIFDTAVDGYYDFRVNSVPTASIINNKFVFNKGRRRNVNTVTTNITVADGYDYIAVDTSLPLPAYTIMLPVSPTIGDTYEFKDVNGNAATTNVTIDGNGKNIDGISTLIMNTNFASFVVTYTGTQWSVS